LAEVIIGSAQQWQIKTQVTKYFRPLHETYCTQFCTFIYEFTTLSTHCNPLCANNVLFRLQTGSYYVQSVWISISKSICIQSTCKNIYF